MMYKIIAIQFSLLFLVLAYFYAGSDPTVGLFEKTQRLQQKVQAALIQYPLSFTLQFKSQRIEDIARQKLNKPANRSILLTQNKIEDISRSMQVSYQWGVPIFVSVLLVGHKQLDQKTLGESLNKVLNYLGFSVKLQYNIFYFHLTQTATQLIYKQSGLQQLHQSLPAQVIDIPIIVKYKPDQQNELFKLDNCYYLSVKDKDWLIQGIQSALYQKIVQPIGVTNQYQIYQIRRARALLNQLAQDIAHIKQVLNQYIYKKDGATEALNNIESALQMVNNGTWKNASKWYTRVLTNSNFGSLDTFSTDYKMGVLFPMFLAFIYPLGYFIYRSYQNVIF